MLLPYAAEEVRNYLHISKKGMKVDSKVSIQSKVLAISLDTNLG